MPYTHFRYIAYEVPTATNRTDIAGPTLAGLPPGGLCDAIPDIPVAGPRGTTADWFVRLRRLAAVVHIAQMNVRDTDDPSTLKVFVAPEFYFRPADPATHHTYSTEEYLATWDALDRMFHAVRLKNWLIVPGSVLWHSDTMVHGQRTFYNSVWHMRGGVGTGEARRIEKRLPSGLDGIPMAFAVGKTAELQAAYAEKELVRERLFEVDANTTVGVEICLDHAGSVQVLKKTLAERQGDPTDSWKRGGPSLHVLTAGGMPIVPGSVVARPGGYLLRNDGYADPPLSELRKVTGYRLTSGAPAQAWTDKSIATLEPDPADAFELPLRGDTLLVPGLPGPGTYDMPAQRLRIYPAKPLP
ncbi:hypothetical protein [Amycolatopsis sp. NBC_01286]|uniref:hypothetical protein n=1 Tax=Amycolatopsis sp. NBC_01286 TaxID=2903560 RepID=UPI002E134B75|nr:hypothetical protein OG570_32135 [Amycolatopsis sp. NBC_01286]